MAGFLSRLQKAPLTRLRFAVAGRVIMLAGAVGIVTGIGAIVFHVLCHAMAWGSLEWLVGYDQGGPAGESGFAGAFPDVHRTIQPWMLLVTLTAGALISGWIVYTFAPEAQGHGTDAAIDAYHNKRGIIRSRVPIVKMIASAITLGTGGSGGREGPIAQIGAGFGSFLGTRLGLTDSERRILMLAGIGAGIGAIFHAPLAGAIFAIEVLYIDPDFESEGLIPAFISTIVAYCVFGIAFGFQSLFKVHSMRFEDPRLLLPLTALAFAMAMSAWLYVRCFYGTHRFFGRLKIPRLFRPVIGAAAAGVVAIVGYYGVGTLGLAPEQQQQSLSVLSFGYGFLQNLVAGEIPESFGAAVALLLFVGFGKIVTTSLTIGSGGSAGIFGPSMVIGGALGGVVGLVFQKWFPGLDIRVDVFVILGMAAFFSAAANTPVSTLIMVSEMTSSYTLLLPSMWVCALAYLMGRGWSIYERQVGSRFDSRAHRGDFVIDVLKGMTVREALESAPKSFETVPLDMPLDEINRLLTRTSQTCFPVVDKAGCYRGMFSIHDVREFLYEPGLGKLALAQDLMNAAVRPMTMQTDLSGAIGTFAIGKYQELPVVDPDQPNSVCGMLRQQDIIAAYNRHMESVRSETGGKTPLPTPS